MFLKRAFSLSAEQIDERIKIAISEINEHKKLGYFHLIMNEDAEFCFEEFINYIKLKYNSLQDKLL